MNQVNRYNPVFSTRNSMVQLTCLLAIALLQSGCSLFGIRSVEEAGYTVIQQQEPFELRRYDSLVIAQTTVAADFDDASGIAFRRLFDYISGANRQQQKISMTAPVIAADTAGETIDMTAPVVAEASAQGWRFAFVLPRDIDLASAPQPTNPDISLVAVPVRTVAVARYSGSWNEASYRDNLRRLQQWMADEGLRPGSTPRVAGYDPPWTLPFLRRNEVLVDVEL